MANYATLKAAIAAAIKQNGNKEITGNLLQQQLLAMVNSLGTGYQYMGIATPSTNPGTPDQRVFYIASENGTYPNFGGVTIKRGITIFKYDSDWSNQTIIVFESELYGGGNNPTVGNGVVKGLFGLFGDGVVFKDEKTDINPISYFDNPFIPGFRYRVKNISEDNISFTLFDSSKNIIHAFGVINTGQSIEFVFNYENVAYIGGWLGELIYAISVSMVMLPPFETLQDNNTSVPTGHAVVSAISTTKNEALKNGALSALQFSTNGVTLKDEKTQTDPISYFENPFQKGRTYKIENHSSVTISFSIFDANKNVIQSWQIPLNGFISITYNSDNGVYIGGYANALEYIIRVTFPLDYLSNQKQPAESLLTDFPLRNGYIHYNISAGFIENNDYRTTYPIWVNKGAKLIVKFKTTYTAITIISKTDKYGTSYVSLAKTDDLITEHGYDVCEYVATEDMFVCLCGHATWFHAEIETPGNYATGKDIINEATFSCSNTWQHRFKIIKGHRYLVKNTGSNNTSCFTRYENDGDYSVDGGLIDKIVSEQTADQIIPNSLNANSWTVFVASEDANYIVGYAGQQTTIYIKDLDSIQAVLQEYKTGVLSRKFNVVFQSREGRVSSVYYPNNTKWGIKEAARNQYDRIRFTIRKTTDGYYFLCHNETINSVARNPDGSAISESVSSNGKTLAELNAYDWGILYGQKYAGLTVPLLEDALYYASLYNLGVTFEINFTLTEADYPLLFNLAAKYALLDSLIIVPYNVGIINYFKQRNKKVSYWWGGVYSDFLNIAETLKEFLTGENNVYIYNSPYNEYPSADYINAIWSNGFIPHFSNVFNKPDFIETVEKGMALIDVANVPFVKSTLREYVDSLID